MLPGFFSAERFTARSSVEGSAFAIDLEVQVTTRDIW